MAHSGNSDVDDTSSPQLRVLEFYSGIGGMHYAAKACGVHAEVTSAFDINPVANQIYRHNFPDTPVSSRNIESISADELDSYSADVFLMSPPCQPYTRQGLQAGSADPRSHSFLVLLDVLPILRNPPRYLLIENVKGFDTSETRAETIRVLHACSYSVEEYLLSPIQCGIPNSRLRYYLLATRLTSAADETTAVPALDDVLAKDIVTLLPDFTSAQLCSTTPLRDAVQSSGENACEEPTGDSQETSRSSPANSLVLKSDAASSESSSLRGESFSCNESPCVPSGSDSPVHEPSAKRFPQHSCSCGSQFVREMSVQCRVQPVATFLESNLSDNDLSALILSESILMKHRGVLDVVKPGCRHSCCFTKNYGRFLRGTGSVLEYNCQSDNSSHHDLSSSECDPSHNRALRYFSPREVANLMCFPGEFSFPETVTTKQRYRCLGNSLNVLVVTWLLRHLFRAHAKDS